MNQPNNSPNFLNPNFSLQNVDPRPAWDSKEPALDQEAARRDQYIEIAETIGDPALIEMTRAHAADLSAARSAYEPARELLDQHMFDLSAARAELVSASAAVQAGSLDRERALSDHANLIAAQAKVTFLAQALPAVIASADGARVRVSRVAGGSAAHEAEAESLGFVDRLFSYENFEAAFTDAAEAGRKSRVAASVWWKIVEPVAIADFARRLAPLQADAANTGTRGSDGRFIRDPRRVERVFPTVQDLEMCFAKRRAGFEAERARLAAQLQAFTGQLQDVGGAL